MQTWEIIAHALAPDGARLELARRGSEWVVRAAGHTLMSSRAYGSEELLASNAIARAKTPRAVLVGGLGPLGSRCARRSTGSRLRQR